MNNNKEIFKMIVSILKIIITGLGCILFMLSAVYNAHIGSWCEATFYIILSKIAYDMFKDIN